MTLDREALLARYAFILFPIALILVVSGAVLALYFGYAVYGLIVNPSESTILNYFLQQLPPPDAAGYTFKFPDSGGKTAEIFVPAAFLAYGRFLIAFLLFGMIAGVATNVIIAGTTIFKVFIPARSETKIIDLKKEVM